MHNDFAGYERRDSGLIVPSHKLAVVGRYDFIQKRDGKIIDEWSDENLVVNEGLDSILNVVFNAQTQIGTWYIGLYEGNYTPVATVTGATIVAAATETTAYVSSTRPAYVEAAASGQSITNSASKADFVFNATKTLYGAFLISTPTKSDTAGKLMSAAKFTVAKTVSSGDELLLTYTFSIASY